MDEIVWSQEIGFGPNGTYQFPDKDGVYVIAEVDVNGIYQIRYVGQGNIYDRMEAHKDWQNEPNECLSAVMKYTGSVKVKSVVIGKQEDRDNIEYTYWKHYSDKGHNLCNKIEPSGKWVAQIPLPF